MAFKLKVSEQDMPLISFALGGHVTVEPFMLKLSKNRLLWGMWSYDVSLFCTKHLFILVMEEATEKERENLWQLYVDSPVLTAKRKNQAKTM